MKKKILILLGTGLALLVVGLLVLGLFLDSAVKKGVETFGPPITKTTMTLESVGLSIFSGAGSVHGLVIGNPEGFKQPSSIHLGKASLELSPGSLLSDKIVIKSIDVDAPEITFEGGLKGNNLSKLLANIEAAAAVAKTADSKASPASPTSSKKIQVDDFRIAHAKLNVTLTDLGGRTMSLTLPEIHLTGLGQGSGGLTPADLSKRVITAILGQSLEAVTAELGKVGKAVTDMGLEAGKGAAAEAGKAVKGLGDLFKKK